MNKYRVIRGALYCCDIRTYRKTNYMYATIKKMKSKIMKILYIMLIMCMYVHKIGQKCSHIFKSLFFLSLSLVVATINYF